MYDSTLNLSPILTTFLTRPLTIAPPPPTKTFCPGLSNFYHNAPADVTGQDSRSGIDHLAEPNFRGHRCNLSPVEVAFQAAPGLLPQRQRAHDRIDAKKRHTAQNKRSHAGRQVHAPGKAAGGNRPAI